MAGSRERARTAMPITHYRIILTKEQPAATARLVVKRYSGPESVNARSVATQSLAVMRHEHQSDSLEESTCHPVSAACRVVLVVRALQFGRSDS